MRIEINENQLETLKANGTIVAWERDGRTPQKGETVLQIITGGDETERRTGSRYFWVPGVVTRLWGRTTVQARFEFSFAGGSSVDTIRAQDHPDGGDASYIVVQSLEDLPLERRIELADLYPKRSRYEEGDVVVLYGEPAHEGPHESDADQQTQYAVVQSVETHTYNEDWVTGYVVRPIPGGVIGGQAKIRPGQIHRLALAAEVWASEDLPSCDNCERGIDAAEEGWAEDEMQRTFCLDCAEKIDRLELEAVGAAGAILEVMTTSLASLEMLNTKALYKVVRERMGLPYLSEPSDSPEDDAVSSGIVDAINRHWKLGKYAG